MVSRKNKEIKEDKTNDVISGDDVIPYGVYEAFGKWSQPSGSTTGG
jgi:hypothetical protein